MQRVSATLDLTISDAMARSLRTRFRIQAEVFRDRPAPIFVPLDPPQRDEVRSRILHETAGAESAIPLIVAPTGWTADEDIDLLFEALRRFEQRVECDTVRLRVVLTGTGPLRSGFQRRFAAVDFRAVDVRLLWLSMEDYAALLGSADVGVSLHRSASGVDLPMKIADMRGAGLPLLVLDYGDVLREAVGDEPAAAFFRSAEELADALVRLSNEETSSATLRPSPPVEERWETNWSRRVLPLVAPAPRRGRRRSADAALTARPTESTGASLSPSPRRRLLLVQPSLQPPGGGNAVAVWFLTALKDLYEVTVFAWEPVDLDAINLYYGTSLKPSDFRVIMAPWLPRFIRSILPFPIDLLKRSLMTRNVQKMARDYQVVASVNNEIDAGRPAIQYVHFPWGFWPRPQPDIRWYHRPPGLLALYFALSNRVGRVSWDRIRQNLTLVNSDWTGERYLTRYGRKPITVYPPVHGTFPPVSWDQRSNGFLCVGRISPEKRIDRIMEILDQVRTAGHDVHLHIVGTFGHRSYGRKIRRMADDRSWVTLEQEVSRASLITLLSTHRWGIHGFEEEHFGMAVAELTSAGCIVFAPRGGGQVEIVREEELLYESTEDAVAKIIRVLDDPELQTRLRDRLRSNAGEWTVERFIEQIRGITRDFDLES